MIYNLQFTIYNLKFWTLGLLNRKSKIVNRKSDERGVALLMVLWVMVFLTVIVSEFAHSMRVEINITRNFKEEAESLSLAEAGLNLAFAEILKDSGYTITDKDDDVIFVKKGVNVQEFLEKKPVRKGIALGSGNISYYISDEDSKININSAARDTIIKLLELSGVEEGELRDIIADSIEDWRDEDSLHRLNGAEDDYYMSLPVPYHCKNGSFNTVEELLMVRGMTPEILYGNLALEESRGVENREKEPAGHKPAVSKANLSKDGRYTGIYQYITVAGSGTINMNTAPETLLRIIRGDEEAKNIISKRQGNNGVYDDNQKSGSFTILSTGIIGVGSRTGVPPVKESGVGSQEQENKSGFNKRTIKVICSKSGSGKDARVSIRYWNDNYIPYRKNVIG
ncbi:MAG: general secretion pathway protein GspK [Nitrospinae bacterium]|nr:general secretion pathway protein GspK [Nitrospinota bacterium]